MAMFVRSLICLLYKCGVSPRWIATLTCQYRNRITNTLVDAGLYTVKPRRKTYPKIAVDNTTAKAEQTTAKVKAQIISDAGRQDRPTAGAGTMHCLWRPVYSTPRSSARWHHQALPHMQAGQLQAAYTLGSRSSCHACPLAKGAQNQCRFPCKWPRISAVHALLVALPHCCKSAAARLADA